MTAASSSRKILTEIPGPVSRSLQQRRLAAVAAGVSSTLPAFIARGADGLLIDVDGNELIDLGSGIAVTGVGNPAPAVSAAVAAAAQELIHTCFMVTPYESYVSVCERLNELTPGEHEKRSALFNSGAEAVENAIKIARLVTGKAGIAVFDHAYHGRTNLTMAMTAKNMPYKHRFGPFVGDIHRVPMSYPFRDPQGLTGEQAAARALEQLERQAGAANLGALIIEPIQGEGGFIVPAPGFLPALRRWCDANGVLLIADEIQTGFCRTGQWFACEHEQLVPDLITTAKGIAGGMPLAAVTGKAEIMDAVHGGGLGGTYGGNPVACAGALAAIETMERLDLNAAARAVEAAALPRLTALAERFGRVGDVRGRGAMLAIEFVDPATGAPDAAAAAAVAKRCHAAGVVVLTCGSFGNVIRLLPPMVIPAALLTEGLDVLEEAVAAPLG